MARQPPRLGDLIGRHLRDHFIAVSDEIMAEIMAKRLLKRAGFVVMKRPPEIGAASLGRSYEG
ncbi:MAG: hypothetical protein ACLQJR_27435 [Stellaceae bacterium]